MVPYSLMFRLYTATRPAQGRWQANSIRSRVTRKRSFHRSSVLRCTGNPLPTEFETDPQPAELSETLEQLLPAKEAQEGLQREERSRKNDLSLGTEQRARRKHSKGVTITEDYSVPGSKLRATRARTKAQEGADNTVIDPKARATRTKKKAQDREDKTLEGPNPRTSRKKAQEGTEDVETKFPAQVTPKQASSEGEHDSPNDLIKDEKHKHGKTHSPETSIVLTHNDYETINQIIAAIKKKKLLNRGGRVPVLSSGKSEAKPRSIVDDEKSRRDGARPCQKPEDPAKDITRYLRWGMGKTRKDGRTGADKKRMNIISEEACDDIIERLKPSLEKHQGCDIIDISPGAGVWSKKVHEMLKPRTHILLEPDKIYEPLLEPLVDTPGSTYKLVPKSGLIWGHLENVMSSGLLPFQVPLERGDPRLDQPNDTLLVLANIAYHPKRPYKGFSSIAQMVMYQFVASIRAHSLFQKYGLVRMLVWTNDDEKSNIGLGRSMSCRSKAAIETGILCKKFEEVASSTVNTSSWSRETRFDVESARRVVEKMKRNGIKAPLGRESELMKRLAGNEPVDYSVPDRGYTQTEEFAKKLEVLRRAYESKAMDQMEDGATLYNHMKSMKHQKSSNENSYRILFDLGNQYAEILAAQKNLSETAASPTSPQRDALDNRVRAWENAVAALSVENREHLYNNIQNYLAISSDPPLLLWDQREYEPLKLHPHEFWPRREMCLVDIHPKALWPVLRANQDHFDILEYLLSSLFTSPLQSVKHGLKGLLPGAYEWLSEECKTLKDCRKGGNPDLDKLAVRMMTEEMLEDLVETWIRWPWKPSKYEMLSRMGTIAYNPDVDPGEKLGSGGI
ncbi:hypothetical protein PZA11_004896 [Diplocarpon coronariae]